MDDISEEYLSNIYKDVIMDHFRNAVSIQEYDYSQEELNPFCGDKVSFKVKISEERVITDVSAVAEGCTVRKAAASLLSVFVDQMIVDQLPDKINKFEKFLKNEDDSDYSSELGCLCELGAVRKHPVRLKCVLLPVRALVKIIDKA